MKRRTVRWGLTVSQGNTEPWNGRRAGGWNGWSMLPAVRPLRLPLLLLVVLVGAPLVACGESSPPPASPPPPPPSATVPPPPPVASSAPVEPPPPAPPPAKPMAELQLAALKAGAAALDAHDAVRYAEIFTPNVLHKEASAPDVHGRREVVWRTQLLFDAFPDFKFTFDRVWLKDHIAVATWRWTGTDRGGFLQKKATNRPAGIAGVAVGFFNADGQVRQIHLYEDGQNVVAQLDPAAKPGSFRAPPARPDEQNAALEVFASKGHPDEAKTLEIARALYDAIEAKKEADSAALFADDAVVEDMASAPKPGKGPAAWKALLKGWTQTFGAFTELPLYNLMAIGDTFVVERVLKGTTAGKPTSLHAIDIVETKGGKITRFTSFSNGLELVAQTKAAPKGPPTKR